jgi:NADP-dependent 3-hydroxy acid dehydrogenase YdfG
MVQTEFKVRFKGDTDRAEKVYQGFMPLQPEDIATSFTLWYRDRIINIADLVVMSTAQVFRL